MSGMSGGSTETHVAGNNQYPMYTDYSGNLSMSGTFTPSGTVGNDGDTESKPINLTTKLWRRIA